MRQPILPEGFETHDFIGAYKTEPNPRKKMRLLGLSHLQEGKTFIEIGELLRVGRQTVSAWLTRFIDGGFENLKDADRSGPKPHLAPEQELCFQQAVVELQEKREGGSVSGEDIRELLLTQFNAEYTLSGVYDLLKRLDMSWITCRSKHPKTDEKQQDDFKKTSQKTPKRPFPTT